MSQNACATDFETVSTFFTPIVVADSLKPATKPLKNLRLDHSSCIRYYGASNIELI